MAKYTIMDCEGKVTSRYSKAAAAQANGKTICLGGVELVPVKSGHRCAVTTGAAGTIKLLRLGHEALGSFVEVRHSDGCIARYSGLAEIEPSLYGKAGKDMNYVYAEDPVKAGAVIGYIDGSVYFTVQDANGAYIDPMPYLRGKAGMGEDVGDDTHNIDVR